LEKGRTLIITMMGDRSLQKRIHPSLFKEIEKIKLSTGIKTDSGASKVIADRINATKYVEEVKKKGNKWLSIETKIKL